MQFNRGSAAVKFYEIDYNDSVVFRRTHRLLTKVILRVRMKNKKIQGFWVIPKSQLYQQLLRFWE